MKLSFLTRLMRALYRHRLPIEVIMTILNVATTIAMLLGR